MRVYGEYRVHIPAGLRGGGVERWDERRPEDCELDGYDAVRDEDAADSVRRYGEEVGSAGGMGCCGRWGVDAAGGGEVRETPASGCVPPIPIRQS